MNLEQLKHKCQAEANRDASVLCILNLNPYSPLYVIRKYDPRMEGNKDLVFVCCPQMPQEQ